MITRQPARMMLRAAPLALAVSLSGAAAMAAQTPDDLRTLSVSGHGEAKAVPDRAVLSAGVVSDGATADAALAANRRAMNAVFAELKRDGIPDRDIQTSEFSVSPQYADAAKGPQRITGYRVSNAVNVTVDDLGRLGAAVDALVKSGANSLGDVNFSVRDPAPLMAEARAAAVKDAIARAETIATAAGVHLGPVQSISEDGAVAPRPQFRAMAMTVAEAPTPIAAGEDTLSDDVSVTFTIH
jgi:uncharacterized protein YggE